MLNFVYYPVSAILWFWHKAFAFVLPGGFAWTLAVVFLVFTLRALLYKPFVHQIRSMRRMQEFAPEIQKLKKKYGNDKQKMAAEMQKLQGEHGVNPLGGCLPVLVQAPVFIGLFHVLRGFHPDYPYNYVFDRADIVDFNAASIVGAKLGAALHPYAGGAPLAAYGATVGEHLVVMIPLAIAAAVFTHITARHSIARQTAAQAANPQAAMMNKLMLWLFPVGAIAFSPFLPLAVLVYFLANNLWTLGQQRVVYTKIDKEEAERKTRKTEAQRSLAPKVGQKPVRDTRRKKPGAKPLPPKTGSPGKGPARPSAAAGKDGAAGGKQAGKTTVVGKAAAAENASSANGSAGNGERRRPTERGRKR